MNAKKSFYTFICDVFIYNAAYVMYCMMNGYYAGFFILFGITFISFHCIVVLRMLNCYDYTSILQIKKQCQCMYADLAKVSPDNKREKKLFEWSSYQEDTDYCGTLLDTLSGSGKNKVQTKKNILPEEASAKVQQAPLENALYTCRYIGMCAWLLNAHVRRGLRAFALLLLLLSFGETSNTVYVFVLVFLVLYGLIHVLRGTIDIT